MASATSETEQYTVTAHRVWVLETDFLLVKVEERRADPC